MLTSDSKSSVGNVGDDCVLGDTVDGEKTGLYSRVGDTGLYSGAGDTDCTCGWVTAGCTRGTPACN